MLFTFKEKRFIYQENGPDTDTEIPDWEDSLSLLLSNLSNLAIELTTLGAKITDVGVNSLIALEGGAKFTKDWIYNIYGKYAQPDDPIKRLDEYKYESLYSNTLAISTDKNLNIDKSSNEYLALMSHKKIAFLTIYIAEVEEFFAPAFDLAEFVKTKIEEKKEENKKLKKEIEALDLKISSLKSNSVKLDESLGSGITVDRNLDIKELEGKRLEKQLRLQSTNLMLPKWTYKNRKFPAGSGNEVPYLQVDYYDLQLQNPETLLKDLGEKYLNGVEENIGKYNTELGKYIFERKDYEAHFENPAYDGQKAYIAGKTKKKVQEIHTYEASYRDKVDAIFKSKYTPPVKITPPVPPAPDPHEKDTYYDLDNF